MDLEFNKNEDSMLLLLSERQRKLNQIEKGGGEKSMEKQHAQGKMTARERVPNLKTGCLPLAESYRANTGCKSMALKASMKGHDLV